MSKRQFWTGNTYSVGDVDLVVTIPPRQGRQIVIRYLQAIGGSATSDLRMLAWSEKGKTTINNTEAANSGQLRLAGDGAADVFRGITYAANDFVLVKLDARRYLDALNTWQLLVITTVGGGTVGTIELDSFDNGGCDGETDPAGAVTTGNHAYLMPAEDVYNELIGAATKNFDGGDQAAIFSGKPGHPVSLHLEAGGATAHSIAVTAEYVEV